MPTYADNVLNGETVSEYLQVKTTVNHPFKNVFNFIVTGHVGVYFLEHGEDVVDMCNVVLRIELDVSRQLLLYEKVKTNRFTEGAFNFALTDISGSELRFVSLEPSSGGVF